MTEKASTRNRPWLYLSIVMLLMLAGSVSAVSARDPQGWPLRTGMILLTVGASLWLPARLVLLIVPFLWLGPHYLRFRLENTPFPGPEALLEIPGLVALVLFGILIRRQLSAAPAVEANEKKRKTRTQWPKDEKTGVYVEELFRESVEQELARSQRFGREFAVMLAAVDPMRVRFDYRDKAKWASGLKATATILLDTRRHIDRVFRHGDRGFALLLPETGPAQISGLLRRLTSASRSAKPGEGEPGGPLPLHFGVTFFPQCATAVDDLLRRAEVALRLAEGNPARVQIDGAEAPEMAAGELARHRKLPGQAMPAQRARGAGAAAAGAASRPSAEAVMAQLGAARVREPARDNGTPAPLAHKVRADAFNDLEPAEGGEQAEDTPAPPPVDPKMELAVAGLLERLDETAEFLRTLRESERTP